MTNTEKLLQLVKENPQLPIVPMVYYEIVGDDYGRWIGKFGNCYVGEYALLDDRYFDDREDFKENYYGWNDDELCEKFNYNPHIHKCSVERGEFSHEELEENEKNEKLLDEYLEKIADKYFIDAIICNIDTL